MRTERTAARRTSHAFTPHARASPAQTPAMTRPRVGRARPFRRHHSRIRFTCAFWPTRVLRARALLHPLEPCTEVRVARVEAEPLDQDLVEEPRVPLLVEEREAQERERRAVGDRELAEEILAAGQELLEEVERRRQLG